MAHDIAPPPLIPLRILTSSQRAALVADAEEHTFEPGTVIVERGDRDADRMFIVTEGTVDVIDHTGRPAPSRVIRPGDFFGERSAVVGEVPRLAFRARTTVRCLSLTGERIVSAARALPVLAQALAGQLIEREGLFEGINHFVAAVTDGAARGELDMARLRTLYEGLDPVLHPGLHDPDTIDFDALEYGLRRLPDNVTRTLVFYLSEEFPPSIGTPEADFRRVSGAMRRPAYELLPGKTIVVLRESHSDLIDFVCALCLYTVEAQKLRRRLSRPPPVGAPTGAGFERDARFSPAERADLRRLWPHDTDAKLRDIAIHHEDFTVEFHRDLKGGGTHRYTRWAGQLIDAIHELAGCEPGDLPEQLEAHIISSNTHSVTNCLNPYLQEHADQVLAWGHDVGHELAETEFHDPQDRVYALARDYRRANAEHEREVHEAERENGVVWVSDTEATGVVVQLIDVERVLRNQVDAGVRRPAGNRPALIVNVDFAYGRQTERILRLLVLTLGRQLASVNVVGKAGALQGERGDLLVPTVFVDQLTGDTAELPGGPGIDADALATRVPDRAVHHGPMLSVAGTLLQDRTLLNFYRNLRGCVGLEMEGTYHCRRIREARHAGLISDDLPARFAYYVSDLPLEHHDRLSRRLRATEGVSPLYAVTREILSAVLTPPPGESRTDGHPGRLTPPRAPA